MKRRRGITLIETLTAITFITLVVTGAAQLTMSVGKSYNRTAMQLDVDQSASQAVQWMTRDLQEAKQVVIETPYSLRVLYPQLAPDGSYIRSLLDTVKIVRYYRGDSNLQVNAGGGFLIREQADGTRRIVCKDIIDVNFTSTNPSSVDITLRVEESNSQSTNRCEMIHRAIFLRNY
jgi:type II secretory pathway pseudopilin PulG